MVQRACSTNFSCGVTPTIGRRVRFTGTRNHVQCTTALSLCETLLRLMTISMTMLGITHSILGIELYPRFGEGGFKSTSCSTGNSYNTDMLT